MAESLDYEYFLNMFMNIASRARVGAESVLSKTRYGQGNLISIVDSPDGRFQFRVNATGEILPSLEQARQRSDALFLTEFFELGKEARHGDRLAYLSEIMGAVDRKSRTFGSEEQRILRATGISQDALNDIMNGRFKSSLVTFRVSETQRAQGANPAGIAEMLRNGEISGSAIFDDEGARLIQLETAGGTKLNQIQIEALFRLAGHGTVTSETVFGEGGALREGKLLKALAKVPKRNRGVQSPRDVSLSGMMLDNILRQGGYGGGRGGAVAPGQLLNSSIFVFDENLYLFARRFGFEEQLVQAGVIEDFVGGIFERFAGSQQQSKGVGMFFDDFLQEVNDDPLLFQRKRQYGGLSKFTKIVESSFQDLIDDMQSNQSMITGEKLKQKMIENINSKYSRNEEQRDRLIGYVEGIFDRNTKAFDGFSVWDRSFYGRIDQAISNEIADLEARLNGGTLSASEKIEVQKRIRDLKNQKTSIGYALEANPEQHTIRAGVSYDGKTYQVKSSTIASNLDEELRRRGYVAVVSTADLKQELSSMGDVPGLNISGLGRSRGIVYLDEVTSGFLGQYLDSPGSEEFIMDRFRELQAQVNTFDQTGMLSPQLIDALKHEASQDLDILPAYARDAARRNREYAKRLLEMYRSGIDVRSAPQLVNFVHNYMQTNAFRVNDGEFQIALPGSYRFSALSEVASDIWTTGGEAVMGGEGRLSTRSRIELSNGQSGEVINFRLKGHGMLFAAEDVQKLHHVLGGFDLDDKSLLHYSSYEKSNGMKSFGFLISRQPSGIEEIMFGKSILDSHSVNSIFGNRKDIMNQIVEMMNLQGQDRITRLQQLSGGSLSYTQDEANQIFEAIENLFFLRRNSVTGEFYQNENISRILESTQRKTQNQISRTRSQMLGALNTEGTVGEHIENILARLYGGPTLGQETMDLITRGGSTLQVSALNRNDPEFASFFVRRELFNAGAGDMTDPILQSLSRLDQDDELRSIYSSLSSFVESRRSAQISPDQIFMELQREIDTRYESASDSAKTMMEIAMDDAFKVQTLLDSEKSGEILGRYVNRSMIAGNALNQIEDLVGTVKSNADLLSYFDTPKYRILYAGQEGAIDAAIQMGRTLSEIGNAVGSAASQGGAVISINNILEQLAAGTPGSEALKGLGSDQRGELMVAQVGRLIGAISGVGDQRIGFDAGLIMKSVKGGSSRLSDSDMRSLMENMLAGAQDFVQTFEASADDERIASVQRTRSVISDLEEILNLRSSDPNANIAQMQRQMFVEKFGLREGKYATTYRSRRLAESMSRQFSSSRNAMTDVSLNYVSSDVKTERIAQQIIDDHKKMLDRVRSSVGGVMEDQIDAIARETSKLGVAESLYHSIAYAIDQHGVNLVDLANELDRSGFAAGIDILDIATVLTDDQDRITQLITKLGDARRLRQLTVAAQSADTSILSEMIGRAVQYRSFDARDVLGESQISGAPLLPRGKKPSDYPLGFRVLTQDESMSALASLKDEDVTEYIKQMLRDYDDFRSADTLSRDGKSLTPAQQSREGQLKKLLKRYGEEAFEQLRAYIDDPNASADARFVANALRASQALVEAQSKDLSFFPEAVSDPNTGSTSARSRVRRGIDDAAQGVSEASRVSSNYRRFMDKLDDGDFRELFRNKLIRKTAVGIGALVAGSFLYESFTDRTQEDIQGPPLLPGGSAYEEYPIRSPNIPSVGMGSSNSSMSYNISVNGNQQKIREFNERASALTNGNTSTTIYNSLPRSRRDPYSEMGQRY